MFASFFKWLENLPPSISRPLQMLIIAIVTYFATQRGIVIPPAPPTQINVVMPDEPVFMAVAQQDRTILHPRMHFFLRAKLAGGLMDKKGLSFADAWVKTRKLSADDYAGAMMQAAKVQGAEAQTQVPFGKLGDGTLLNSFLEWLKSPQGQAFIELLLKLLMGLLFVEPDPRPCNAGP